MEYKYDSIAEEDELRSNSSTGSITQENALNTPFGYPGSAPVVQSSSSGGMRSISPRTFQNESGSVKPGVSGATSVSWADQPASRELVSPAPQQPQLHQMGGIPQSQGINAIGNAGGELSSKRNQPQASLAHQPSSASPSPDFSSSQQSNLVNSKPRQLGPSSEDSPAKLHVSSSVMAQHPQNQFHPVHSSSSSPSSAAGATSQQDHDHHQRMQPSVLSPYHSNHQQQSPHPQPQSHSFHHPQVSPSPPQIQVHPDPSNPASATSMNTGVPPLHQQHSQQHNSQQQHLHSYNHLPHHGDHQRQLHPHPRQQHPPPAPPPIPQFHQQHQQQLHHAPPHLHSHSHPHPPPPHHPHQHHLRQPQHQPHLRHPHLAVPPAAVLPSPAVDPQAVPPTPLQPPPIIISATPASHASFRLPPTAPGSLGRADQEIEGLRRALAADPIVGVGMAMGQGSRGHSPTSVQAQLAEVWRLQQELFLRQAEPLGEAQGAQEFDMYSRRPRDRKRRPLAHGEASVEGLMQTLQQLGDSIDRVMGDPNPQPQ